MPDGDHESDDLDRDEVARVLDESEGCFATVPDQEIAKPKRGLRCAASEQAHEGATPSRSPHDAGKNGDDDFEEGGATIRGAGKQRCGSTS